MCEEMRNTSIAIAAASAIVTHFRFTIAGSALDSEPARFNEHLTAHKEKAAKVAASLHKLRGHCHTIDLHLKQLRKKAESLSLDKLLLLLGINSAKREQEVVTALERISDEETQGYLLVTQLSTAVQKALEEVGNTLGPRGAWLPDNVPKAAVLLAEYAEAFGALETQANYLALELEESVIALQ
jgi:cell division protein ZapA (FtsZ GTPase activity inhibitor)